MASTLSPNMSLVIPTTGQEPGPAYANDVNASLTIVDSHNHSAGSGVQINPSGININSSLTFNNQLATNLQGASFYIQSGSITNPQTIYVTNGTESPTPLPDLWYYDGTNQIQITSGGQLAATPTTVAGLSYAGGTFTFVQGTGSTTPANLSVGSVTIRPNTAGTTNGVVLSPPSTISSEYDLQLPQIPANTSFLTLDTSGNIAPTISTSGGITGSNIAATTITASNIVNNTITAAQIANNTITTTQISNSAGITGTQIADSTIAPVNIVAPTVVLANGSGAFSTTSSSPVLVTNQSIVVTQTNSGRPIYFTLIGDIGAFGSIGNSATTGAANFEIIRGSSPSGGTVVNSVSVFSTSSATIHVPCSSLNGVDFPPTGVYNYTVYAAQTGGATVVATGVRLQAFAD